MGTFVCPEVTIGEYGIVDMLSYSTKNIWRCYELKISKSDFHSKAAKTFVGNYNYYVITSELYEQVKNEIPKEIGCWVYGESEFGIKSLQLRKNPKHQMITIDDNLLKYSLIKSLSRESDKLHTLQLSRKEELHKYNDAELIGEINKRRSRRKLDKIFKTQTDKMINELKEKNKKLKQENRLLKMVIENK